MSNAIEILQAALQRGMENRPVIGGFPYLAETLRKAGVTKNLWFLPSLQVIYLTVNGPVVDQWAALLEGMAEIPSFDEDAVIAAIRSDQAGESTFPEFLSAIWKAGIVRYEVDFLERTVTYSGVLDDQNYIEAYPAVRL